MATYATNDDVSSLNGCVEDELFVPEKLPVLYLLYEIKFIQL